MGSNPNGDAIFDFNGPVVKLGSTRYLEVVVLRRGGSNPLGSTNFNGSISKRQGDCGKRSGEIPNMGSNPIASTNFNGGVSLKARQ